MSNIVKFSKLYKGDDKMKNIEKTRMLEIEEITKELLINIDFEKSPYVDISSIVQKDGFDIKPQKMDIDTTGCLFVNDEKPKKERLILVNTIFRNPENEDDVVFKKSRFITAHEYGHFKLHKKEGEPFIYAHRDTDHRTDPDELEADYFARSVLMPLSQFELYYKAANQLGNNDKNFTINILSKLFKVTRNKIEKRMEDLLVITNNVTI